MALWFSHKKSDNVLFFDIKATSVAGAYVEIIESAPPRFFYTKRVALAEGDASTQEERLTGALTTLSEALIREGAPIKHRATKSGTVDAEVIAFGYPWQKTEIRTKTFERGQAFIFTEEMRNYALEEIVPEKDMLSTGKFLLATLLNGYHVGTPVGKKVNRADLLMLSSSVDREITELVSKTLRKSFHQSQPHFAASGPLLYFVLQDLYPHEEELIIMNISRGVTDISLVKKHLLVDTLTVCNGTESVNTPVSADIIPKAPLLVETFTTEEQAWIDAIAKTFSECSSKEALPRTIFLLVEEGKGEAFKRLLDSEKIRQLWLSDTKLTIVPIEEKHLASFVKMEGEAQQDLYLSFLALFYSKHKNLIL